MLARIRETVPDAAVTSDFIVGFCGETDDDFQLTCELVRESRFKNSFIFKYSERPGTKGAELYRRRRARRSEAPPQQRAAGAAERDQRRRQPARSSAARSKCWSKARAKPAESTATSTASRSLQLTGRTHCDRIVVFDGNRRQIGQTLPITIYDANAHTLFGAVVTQHVGPGAVHAARVSRQLASKP